MVHTDTGLWSHSGVNIFCLSPAAYIAFSWPVKTALITRLEQTVFVNFCPFPNFHPLCIPAVTVSFAPTDNPPRHHLMFTVLCSQVATSPSGFVPEKGIPDHLDPNTICGMFSPFLSHIIF